MARGAAMVRTTSPTKASMHPHTYNLRVLPPPLECVFFALSLLIGPIPFSRRWDMMRYSGIPQIQLDIARYAQMHSWIQWTMGYSGGCDDAGYSGSAAKWLDTRHRDTEGYQGYGEIQI